MNERNHNKKAAENPVRRGNPVAFAKLYLLTFFSLAAAMLCAVVICPPTTSVRASSNVPATPGAKFAPTVPNIQPAPAPAPPGMVWIPGGEFSMGAADPPEMDMVGMQATSDSRPIHRVYVDGFYMDKTDITNAQFAEFVKATGYVTIAEKTPTQAEFPGAPAENLVAGGVVFSPPDHEVPLNDHFQWWSYVKGANWRHPTGPSSSIKGKEVYPVVQVAYPDAQAYAKWAHKRLPTEAEWEFAARGKLWGKPYVWGDKFKPDGKWMANTFQGHFPDQDSGADGYIGLAPVGKFAPNGYGLYDMAGNVWQWTSDWYRPDYYAQLAKLGDVARNPKGPETPFDPSEPNDKKKVHRGGSFLCTDQYCSRYMVGTRGKGEVSTGTNHLGFRCVSNHGAKSGARNTD
ncbi:MAG TPA: formylglycine-generating enzyme family protein [Candidatus Sulfotelmatobacter sp.]|nr:formylglycine-generating enzyme family protein [Candidatus Sulfotelmatobacter sp.]